MIVDDLVPDPRRRASIRVLVGGRPVWTVPAEVIAELGLTIGQPVAVEAQARLDRAADEEGAVRAGLRSLERRAHGLHELALKLERKGHPSAAIAAALTRLTALGLLDDAEFARLYVHANGAKGRGPVRMRHDLTRLGVARDLTDRALAEFAATGEDPIIRARALAERRLRALGSLPREARRRRLAAFLTRRGFGAEAGQILEQLCP